MEPLLQHLLRHLGCSIDVLRQKMEEYDKKLCTRLRKLPIFYNGEPVEFQAFSNRDADAEKYSSRNPTTVKEVYEGRTGKPMTHPKLPCIIQMIDIVTVEKYPLEYLIMVE